jgi:xylulokinase
VLNLPLDLPKSGEFGAAMGAARLAQCAATGANPLDVMRKPEIDHTVSPRAELTQSYEAAYAKWRAVYPAIKDLT